MADQDADSALSLAQQCADAMWAEDRCSKALGMSVLEVAPGFARVALTVRQDMLNGQGNCHGGIMFTLADSTRNNSAKLLSQIVKRPRNS